MAIIYNSHLAVSKPVSVESDYNAFEHLWRSIIPMGVEKREESLMLMLSAYLDESGTDSSYLTIGGCLSTVQRWEKFQLEWQELLNDFGLEYSHAVDMAHFKLQFERNKGWDETKRLNFEKRAHKIIKDNIIQPFDVSLCWEDYDFLIPSYKGKDVPSAYAVLVNGVMSLIAHWTTVNGYLEPIHYVFERKIGEEGWINKNYANAAQNIAVGGALHFASLTFAEGKKETDGVKPLTQLQAADMIAYEANKYKKDELDGFLAERGRPRASLTNLRPDDFDDDYTYYFTRDGLADYLKFIEEAELKNEKET